MLMQSLPYYLNLPLLLRSHPVSGITGSTVGTAGVPGATSNDTSAQTTSSATPVKEKNSSTPYPSSTSISLSVSSSRVLHFTTPLKQPQQPQPQPQLQLQPQQPSQHPQQHTASSILHTIQKFKNTRHIPLQCYKLLDAPNLADDFYLDLLAWSPHNILAVGLNQTTYLVNMDSGEVDIALELHDIINNFTNPITKVTSLCWCEEGRKLAIGTNTGSIIYLDTETKKIVRTFTYHDSRVGTLHWNEHLLASGSRDHTIKMMDLRTASTQYSQSKQYTHTFHCHNQEVCGVRWSPLGTFLASGSNDNSAAVWSLHRPRKPLHVYKYHRAAVKALAWSPHHTNLLATGGGTADKRLCIWDTSLTNLFHCSPWEQRLLYPRSDGFGGASVLASGSTSPTGSIFDTTASAALLPTAYTPAPIKTLYLHSQVCNIHWSSNVDEILATLGFSQNSICVLQYPDLQILAKLTGHKSRVLYTAVSPNGQQIVTGAGDETLRFWDIFPPKPMRHHPSLPALSCYSHVGVFPATCAMPSSPLILR
uniref:Protein FIZZY-RELATED 1 n=2 Tax=Lygus hesperus TaxID=30085 RepID=A0A0A9ZAD1_LYGHE